MRFAIFLVVLGPLACEPEVRPDAGPIVIVAPPCIIGDPNAETEIELVYRDVDGVVKPFVEGQEIPLIVPPQAGKVVYIGIRAKNITCRVQLSGGAFDDCRDPPIIFGSEGRPVELREGADGFAEPVNNPSDPFVPNLVNMGPMCPNAVVSRDTDRYPTRFELRVTEALREGEEENRRHLLTGTFIPVCAQPEALDECLCECDADYVSDRGDDQCPTLNDNDLPGGECPIAGEGEGE